MHVSVSPQFLKTEQLKSYVSYILVQARAALVWKWYVFTAQPRVAVVTRTTFARAAMIT